MIILKETKEKRIKKTIKKTIKKSNNLTKIPIILHFLFILNYASFFGSNIFDTICKDLLSKLINNEVNIFEIFKTLNNLSLKTYKTNFSFQNEIILFLKKNTFSKKSIDFQTYFNDNYNFKNFYKTISNNLIKKNYLNKKNYKYIFIKNGEGLKVYLLAIKNIHSIFIIFRGSDELQNIAINLYPLLSEINKNTFNLLPFILNQPYMFNNKVDLTKYNYYDYVIPFIYKILNTSIHSIMNGLLKLNLHFLNDGDGNNIKPCFMYVSGLSLGGQFSNIFSFLYMKIFKNLNENNKKYLPERLFTFPFVSPESFTEEGCNIMNNYIKKNNLFYLNYFTNNDKTRFLYSTLNKYYHIENSNIITSLSFNIETNTFIWITKQNKNNLSLKIKNKNKEKNNKKTEKEIATEKEIETETKTEIKEYDLQKDIFEIFNSLIYYHQNIFGYIYNSILHPCYYIPPYILYKIMYEINKKKELYYLSKDLIDNTYINIIENNEKKRIQLLNNDLIIEYFDYFNINFKEILKKYDINILKKCYIQYNYLHGFEKNDFIEKQILSIYNKNLYYNKNFDFKFLLNIIKFKLHFIENYKWIEDIICYIFKIIFITSNL